MVSSRQVFPAAAVSLSSSANVHGLGVSSARVPSTPLCPRTLHKIRLCVAALGRRLLVSVRVGLCSVLRFACCNFPFVSLQISRGGENC